MPFGMVWTISQTESMIEISKTGENLMTKENYVKMTQPFREHPEMARGIHIINRICTGVMYAAYPLLLLYLCFTETLTGEHLKPAVLVPAISFVLLSWVRAKIDRQRPYEKFEMPPVIRKDTRGNSFPSRHVFSAAMIAMTYFCLSPWQWLGIIFLILSVMLAVVRVVSGVHYISDVTAGFLIAVFCALIGYC